MSTIIKVQQPGVVDVNLQKRLSDATRNDQLADKMKLAMDQARERSAILSSSMPSKTAVLKALGIGFSSKVILPSHEKGIVTSFQSIVTTEPNVLQNPVDESIEKRNGTLDTQKTAPKESPRTKIAHRLETQLMLSPKKLFSKDAVQSGTSSSLDGILQVEKKILQPRPMYYDSLNEMLDSCRDAFASFAKENSSKEIKQGAFVPKAFLILKTLFLSIESKEFLDSYIVRDSQIQQNKDSEMQQKFDALSQQIEKLKTVLHDLGIYGVEEGKSINFWSGREGQQMAADDEALSDSDVPLFKFLFDCWGLIKQRELQKPGIAKELISMLPTLFSALFASYAKQEVNVWMSSKNDGKTSVINVESAFWSAELYALINNPQVTKINLMLHQGKDEQGKDLWADPIDLKSNDQEHVVRKDSLCLSKRGEADLQVPMATLRKTLTNWNEKARRSSESQNVELSSIE